MLPNRRVLSTFSFRLNAIVALAIFAALPLRAQSSSTWIPTPIDDALDLLDQREDWRSWPSMEFPRHPAEKLLAGWVIVLDPGHGGDAHLKNFKRGPTGVREAEINWRVGLLLERLLTDAGAHVTLTRHGDNDVSLSERAKIANTVQRPDGGTGADLFISLHHNAHSKPEANYTTVWFHGEADWSEPDLDAARYIAHALFRNLRTDAALTSYLMSDQQMYPRGFGVLNQTRVPAILLETSFHTNPKEEQRLRDALYNLREAYAIYTGLCEYAYGGRPTQSSPEISLENGAFQFRAQIDDGMPKNWWGGDRNRTLTSSVQLFLDGQPIPATYDPAKKFLSATLPLDPAKATAESLHELRIHHANFAKHHNWPQRYRLTFAQAEDRLQPQLAPLGARRARREYDPSQPSEDEILNLPPPIETAATEPTETPAESTASETAKPAVPASTRTALQSAKPGDIVSLENLSPAEFPILETRITAQPGPQLIFSDKPEYFRAGDGVAMEETVDPGLVRLYLYHVPEPTDQPKTITALIENLGEKPLTLRFSRDAFPKPSKAYHHIGKSALLDFLSARTSLPPLTIAPGEIVPIDSRLDQSVVRQDQLVHGIYEFEIDQPARILTLQRDPDASNAEMAKTLPRLPQVLPDVKMSGAGRGSFPISNLLVTLPSESRLDTADGFRQLVLADGKRDPWVVGHDSISGEPTPNKGNYGIVYRIRLKRESSDGRSLAVFMHNRFSGQPCGYQASAVTISSGQHPDGVVPIPAGQTGFHGTDQAVFLQIFPPLPAGESEIIEIEYSPPAASCLPTPILFVPFQSNNE